MTGRLGWVGRLPERARAWVAPRLADMEAFREHEAARLLLAGVLVGALGGLAAVGFDHGMTAVGELILGTAFPARDPPTWWRALLGPPLAGVVVGLLVANLTRRGRPQGMADVLARVQLDQPSLSLRDGTVSALAAALAVGAGFSGGREGPIVQFASTLSTKACQLLRLRPARARVLVAAGAAAGIAASFNTPLGGAFFALEIILGNFAVESFAPVVAATVTGTVLGQALMGDRIALHLPAFAFRSSLELPLYLVLGGVGALVAHSFKKAVTDVSPALTRLGGPPALRPVWAGLGVGALAAGGLNEVMGNGYGFMEALMRGQELGVGLLLTLLAAKLLATTLTVAGRTGAGLFAPSLFIGCVTGAVFGSGAQALWPDHTEALGAFGIVGMGSVAAAVLGAPVTMVLMLFEMTGNYHVILPLMLALAGSGVVSVAIGSRSLEEMELEREGLSLSRRREAGVLHDLRVEDVYRQEGVERLAEGVPLPELVALFLRRRVEEVYVVDESGRYRGSFHIQDVKPALADPGHTAAVRLRRVEAARLGESVAHVLSHFYDAPGDALPVVDGEGVLLGVLSERDVMAAYEREALRKDARLAHVVRHDGEEAHDDYLELPEGQAMDVLVVGQARAGRCLRDLRLPQEHGCTVVAMSLWDAERGDWTRVAVDAARPLLAEDRLVVIGPADAVRELVEAGEPDRAALDGAAEAPPNLPAPGGGPADAPAAKGGP